MSLTGVTGAANRGFNQRAALGNAKDKGDGFELSRLFGTPMFNFDVVTTDNSISSSNVACNLSSLFRAGVNSTQKSGFEQSNSFRDVTVRVHATDGAYHWDYTIRQRVHCGSTPSIEGDKDVVTNCRARFVAKSNGVNGAALSMVGTACKAPDWSSGTGTNLPTPAGSVVTGAVTVNWLGFSGASRTGGPIRGLVAFTPTFVPSGIAHGYQTAPDSGQSSTVLRGWNLMGVTGAAIPAGDVIAEAIVLPPIDIDVLVTGAGDVVVGVQGTANTVTWAGEVWVTDAVFNA